MNHRFAAASLTLKILAHNSRQDGVGGLWASKHSNKPQGRVKRDFDSGCPNPFMLTSFWPIFSMSRMIHIYPLD